MKWTISVLVIALIHGITVLVLGVYAIGEHRITKLFSPEEHPVGRWRGPAWPGGVSATPRAPMS